MKAIIYKSQTGHTEEYAKMLSEELGIPAVDLGDAKSEVQPGESIIFMTWIRTGDLSAYGRVARKYNICATVAVGINVDGERQLKRVRRRHRLKNDNLFYVRGGLKLKKVRFGDKKIIQMMQSDLAKKIIKKEKKNISVDESDRVTLKGLSADGNYVNKDNLNEIIDWYNSELAKKD